MDLFVVQFQHESLRLNDYYNMPLIYEADIHSDINSLFSFTYYIKGKNIENNNNNCLQKVFNASEKKYMYKQLLANLFVFYFINFVVSHL